MKKSDDFFRQVEGVIGSGDLDGKTVAVIRGNLLAVWVNHGCGNNVTLGLQQQNDNVKAIVLNYYNNIIVISLSYCINVNVIVILL